MATESEVDRLSALPDNILSCNILSHLSLPDVVRNSVLSSRWRFLCKLTPHLHFSNEFFDSLKLPSEIASGRPWTENVAEKVKYINEIIDNILLLHSGNIERFSIQHTRFSFEPEVWKRLHIEQWIHYAALKKVKHMSLKIYFVYLDIPPSLFACHLLRGLELEGFRFSGIPTEFDGFRSLKSCSLADMDGLTDDGVKQLIGLCPLLYKLVLANCSGLINLEFQADNLNSFSIVACHHMESLTVDFPQLVELEIENCKKLIEFRSNSCVRFHDLHTSDVKIPKELPLLNSLRKLSVKACPRARYITFLITSGCLRKFEEVHIQGNDSLWQIHEEDHSEQERGKGEMVAEQTFTNLKKAYVQISSAMNESEANRLGFILKIAPSLSTITVTLPYCRENIHDKEFVDKVVDLQQLYEKVVIRIEKDESRLDATCKYNDYMWYDEGILSSRDVDSDYGSD